MLHEDDKMIMPTEEQLQELMSKMVDELNRQQHTGGMGSPYVGDLKSDGTIVIDGTVDIRSLAVLLADMIEWV